MLWLKRIGLFVLTNLLVILTISFVLKIFNVQPFLNQYGINYQSLLIFCLAWGMGGAFISLLLSKFMAKMMMGVQIIDPTTPNQAMQKILRQVQELSRKAGLRHIPEVGVYQSSSINAFATGPSAKHSLVAVSSGLVQMMNDQEVEAILGHEISHISNGDMVTMTLIQGVVNAFVMFLARILAFIFSGLGKNREESRPSFGSYFIFVFIFEIVFMILGSMVVAWFSRRREFRADLGSAHIAGREKMIAALRKLQGSMEINTSKEVLHPSMQALMIRSNKKKSLLSLFATHPLIEDRIKALEETF